MNTRVKSLKPQSKIKAKRLSTDLKKDVKNKSDASLTQVYSFDSWSKFSAFVSKIGFYNCDYTGEDSAIEG